MIQLNLEPGTSTLQVRGIKTRTTPVQYTHVGSFQCDKHNINLQQFSDCLALRFRVPCSFKPLATIYQSHLYKIPENLNLEQYSSENSKCHTIFIYCFLTLSSHPCNLWLRKSLSLTMNSKCSSSQCCNIFRFYHPLRGNCEIQTESSKSMNNGIDK